MFDIRRLFKLSFRHKSKDVAKERLKLVLMHDRESRVGVTNEFLEKLKEEIIAVIAKYAEISEDGFDIQFISVDCGRKAIPALMANIPLKGLKNI